MKKDLYIYPAIFDYADDGISVEFPDLPGCFTCSDTTAEAMRDAKEAMALHLYGMEKDNDEIPDPSDIKTLVHEQNQVIVLVEVWMPMFRDRIEQKAVKKTLTIPKWLDDLALANNVNFSHVLQDALKARLGVSENEKRP